MIRLHEMLKLHKPVLKCVNNCKNKAGKPRGVTEIQCSACTTVTLNKLRCWILPHWCLVHLRKCVAFYCMLQ
jgi:LSD1 subclass zinc finger protein